MSTTYSGNAANISLLTATITGATNASPIVITTSVSHNFSTNDRVEVEGVGGNTAANGFWTITVVDATHFSLNSSTGNGAYTSGGTASDLALQPSATIPSDGDALNASSIVPALETALDRTQFLMGALVWKVVTFTASGNWTVPATAAFAVAWGYGGGGGGGAGGGGNAGTVVTMGGGGGGSSIPGFAILGPLVPGETLGVVIGAGGTGATGAATPTAPGGAGGTSNVNRGGTVLANFPGAAGGASAPNAVSGAVNFLVPGGGPIGLSNNGYQFGNTGTVGASTYENSLTSTPTNAALNLPIKANTGGDGIGSFVGTTGAAFGGMTTAGTGGACSGASGNFSGGAGGTPGTSNGTTYGGGAGGGGAAGVGGNGAAGGNGASNAGGNGAAGSSASANTGAGGGGGGGSSNSASNTGGSGGNGGSGKIVVLYVSIS